MPPSPHKIGPITEPVTAPSTRRPSYTTHAPADVGSVTPSSYMHQRPTARQKPDGATSHKQSGSRQVAQPSFQTRAAETVYREQSVGRREFQSPAEKMSIVSTSNIPPKRKQTLQTSIRFPKSALQALKLSLCRSSVAKRARLALGAHTIEHLSVGSQDSDFHRHDSPEMITNSSDDEHDNDDVAEDAYGLLSPRPRPGAGPGHDTQKPVAIIDEDAIHEYVSDLDDCVKEQHLGPNPTYSNHADEFHTHISNGERDIDGPPSHATTFYIGQTGGLCNYTSDTDDDLTDKILAAVAGNTHSGFGNDFLEDTADATLDDDQSNEIDDYLNQPKLNGRDGDNDDANGIQDDQTSCSKHADAHRQHANVDGSDQLDVEATGFVIKDARNIS